jgi:hypothetical protein
MLYLWPISLTGYIRTTKMLLVLQFLVLVYGVVYGCILGNKYIWLTAQRGWITLKHIRGYYVTERNAIHPSKLNMCMVLHSSAICRVVAFRLRFPSYGVIFLLFSSIPLDFCQSNYITLYTVKGTIYVCNAVKTNKQTNKTIIIM